MVPLDIRLRYAGLGGGLLSLLAVWATPPARAVEPPQEKVELVSAASATQARLVSRLMATGFALDQLVIPGSRHLGRLASSEVDPLLQAELRKAGPGRPVTTPRPQGDFLVALILPSYPDAILGGAGSAQETSRMGSKVAFSPTNADLLYAEVDVDAEDLAAVCRAKETLITQEVESARAAVQALSREAPLPRLIGAQARLGGALSFTGNFKPAIESFTSIRERLARETPSVMQRKQLAMATLALGILELRRGETDNCVLHHNREMCLFPLSAAARHVEGDGARRALDHFLRYLQMEPDDLEARWLLNVAAMTIGAYPEGIPGTLRIGPEAFASGEDLGRFPDVAGPAGLDLVQSAGGTVTDDFDDDGLLDVVLSSRDPCEPLRFLKSRGDGTFVDETEGAGLAAQLGGLNVTQTDYDNDGRLDLFVMRGGWETAIRNSLLRNEGGGRFTDVTAAAGLGGLAHRTHSAAWGDFDNDGWLDVFVGHELSFSQLFRNRGNGTFEDVTERAGVLFRALTKAVVWGDIDNDGWPDLYVSNFGQRNLLFHNLGNGRFEEVGRERGVSEPYFSFTTWFWDYDNDGWQDLLVVTDVPTLDEQPREYLGLPHRGETLRVYRNRGDGFFEDATRSLGLARVIPTMGANFGDLDHDGYLDFYLGTGAPSYSLVIPNRMFRNQQGRAFVDVTASTGTGHLQKGHGVALADLDNDGDQDVFAHLGGAFPGDKYASALFENPGHGNDWLALRLRGTRTNRPALGARIVVVLDEAGRETQRVRHVTSGGSFGSSPLLQTIGLGRGARVKRIEVDWPTSRTRQAVEDVPVNRTYELVEGETGLRPLARKRFTLGGASSARTSRP